MFGRDGSNFVLVRDSGGRNARLSIVGKLFPCSL